MFTGLIQGVGALRDSTPRDNGLRLHIDVGSLPFTEVELGESIAVNGACLTVVEFDTSSFAVDVSSETLRLTTLGRMTPGSALNLERAMRPSDRFGGHVVSGHVDGMGEVLQAGATNGEQVWRFAAPRELQRYIAKKGSICVDGVSLTVNEVDDAGFAVMLIPHTIAHTAFATTTVGAAVNLEVDLIARYAERLLQGTTP
ncbi:riboflavin synthase [Solilutibacter silvestris]|uniref:Riboflavin synthase n=1 Tax=Solilutibacter silvestris TaxID=1645665 RepID=A0A2K1Q2K1_9GAMM|nr:riboflavin synthase [Lysobacter silvestris]PNS09265.1 ribE: riboflavin synthase, alpha subunit [Lysobacter silvestris]